MVRIWGASDDLVELEGIRLDGKRSHVLGGSTDEIGCFNCSIRILIGDAKGGCVVTMRYGVRDTACWGARLDPIDEDVPCPWGVRIKFNEIPLTRGYSTIVEVDAPNGTPIRVIRLRKNN